MQTGGNATLNIAGTLARRAGRIALQHYGQATAFYKEADSPVTAADHASNDVILNGLRAAFPSDAILSEESRDSLSRLETHRVWIVDPLDGTKEFLSQNGEFSVMIGLAIDHEPVLGAVYLPVPDILYTAERGAGAWVERDEIRVPLRCGRANLEALRMVGSRSHGDALIQQIQEALHIRKVHPSGSVGIKCGLIAEGRYDLYVHPVPYLKEWDTCAPDIILREAGGMVTDCRGARLQYNKPEPVQPDGILACGSGVHARVLPVVSGLYAAAHPAGASV